MDEHFFYVKIYFTRRKAFMELRRMNARTRSSVEQAVLEEARLTYGREHLLKYWNTNGNGVSSKGP